MGCHFSQGSVVRKLPKVVVGLSSGSIARLGKLGRSYNVNSRENFYGKSTDGMELSIEVC